MKRNILIIYYSHSENTRKIAERIHNEIGGTVIRLQPAAPYPTDYDEVVRQAVKEIKAGYTPPLKAGVPDTAAFDTIFVGSPNWIRTVTPPVVTFLKEHNLSGKTIVPFCSHGGGGEENVLKDIAKLCPDLTVLSGIAILNSGDKTTKGKITEWLMKTGIL
jgi:flavodoxin